MSQQEGVIKYELIHSYKPVTDPATVSEINAWRSVIYRLGLIGQDPGRYGGLGYGNISLRPDPNRNVFIISGTQTGHLAQLKADHFCTIEHADFIHNTIRSSGTSKPSSEALTHAIVYHQSAFIQAVIHAHSPEIWHHTAELHLPHTPSDVTYGTLAMARAVETLFNSGMSEPVGIFTMLGHEDGVVAFGRSLEQAAWELIRHLVRAILIEQP